MKGKNERKKETPFSSSAAIALPLTGRNNPYGKHTYSLTASRKRERDNK
jgi:hypothetical protein